MPAAPPMGSNTTADLYYGNSSGPPSPPDVAGLRIYLQPRHRNIKPTTPSYDYVIWLDPSVAVYDDTRFFVPDKNGVQYTLNFNQIEGRGTSAARRACYCNRAAATGNPPGNQSQNF